MYPLQVMFDCPSASGVTLKNMGMYYINLLRPSDTYMH